MYFNSRKLLFYQKLGIVSVKPRDRGSVAMWPQGSYGGKGPTCLSIDAPETNLSPGTNKVESQLIDVNRR